MAAFRYLSPHTTLLYAQRAWQPAAAWVMPCGGSVAEWSNATVSKTVWAQALGGSNPPASATLCALRVKCFLRRNGRVVDCVGLENRRAARFRGFESYFLRHTPETDLFGEMTERPMVLAC